jgi:hypothetical protein
MVSGDANPMRIREREWEAIDLIEKTLTTHDGPFSWEGKFFIHPHVNIWPRCWQEPRPEFWAATSDLPTCAELGRRGIVNTLLFGGYDRTRQAFDAYKTARAEAGLPPPGEDRFSYMAFCYVGDTDEEAFRIGQKIPWFLTVSIKSAPQFAKFQPGAIAPEMAPAAWRTGASRRPRPTNLDVESLVRQGQMFAGNPDTVVRQIKEFRRRVGGIHHIIMMTRQGLVTQRRRRRALRSQPARSCRSCRIWSRLTSSGARWPWRDREPRPRGPAPRRPRRDRGVAARPGTANPSDPRHQPGLAAGTISRRSVRSWRDPRAVGSGFRGLSETARFRHNVRSHPPLPRGARRAAR